MFPLIRSRWDAHTLSRKLRKSLATPDVKWKIDTDDDGQPTLSNGDMRIVLVPRQRESLMPFISIATMRRFGCRW